MKKNVFFILICLFCTFTTNAQTRSWKRGACMSNLREADFEALKTGMSWFYDWGNTPAGVGTAASDSHDIEYCPMRWGENWNPNAIRQYVQAHPNCQYLMTFNEPNFKNQANLTPQEAAARWPEIRALADELGLKIISPGLNYSGWAEWSTPKKWFDAFFQLVPISEVDGIALHCYMGWSGSLIGYVKEYIGYYNKPIWLTEFCSWDDRSGTPEASMKKIQKEYLVDVFDYLETEPMVARYAWFMAKTGENNAVPAFPWMQLLNGHNGTLTENGKIFNNMSSYDDDFYHNTQERIQANHYIRMKGIHLEETKDVDGIINVYDFNNGDYLEYNVEAPTGGEYYLFLRYSCLLDAEINVQIDETVLEALSLPSSGSGWATKRYTLTLNAGKQKIRFNGANGNNVRFNWMNISGNENAETEENNGGGENPGENTNLALNKPVEASSEQVYGTRLARFAVDGAIDEERWATEWEGANIDNDRWFLVDLQQSHVLDRITIYWEAAYATAYYIEASDDKQQWTRIYETNAGAGGTEELIVNGSGRYVRFKCVTRATQYGVSFYEFEVYGKEDTGINTSKALDFEIEQTPETINVYSAASIQLIALYSVSGQLITLSATGTIALGALNRGAYILNVSDVQGNRKTFKVILK
ncbi:MAG: discoidin domain-containing protein [Dysgonamonadaceae bacterium]|jgi:hypothetical protein|nr:discoidin domain-containing protein [Dysgonamonadaceae bacterium]